MELLFLQFLVIWPPLGYVLIFLGTALEGDITLFVAAFLTSAGLFDPLTAVIVALVGTLAGDILWYEAGKHVHKLPHFIATRVARWSAPIDAKLITHPLHTIFLTKFAFGGVHHVVLLRSGALRIPLSRFLKIDIPSILIWFVIVGTLGYFLGFYAPLLSELIKYGEVVIIAAIALIIFAQRFFFRRTLR
jgi:membrane protein DedA with SNARE-associated domain